MRMKRALSELVIEGVQTNIPLHLDLLNDKILMMLILVFII